jgi:hypothetical protein
VLVREAMTTVPVTARPDEVPGRRTTVDEDMSAHGVTVAPVAVPLLVVRVGWQAIGRHEAQPTPRRPLEEVLLP